MGKQLASQYPCPVAVDMSPFELAAVDVDVDADVDGLQIDAPSVEEYYQEKHERTRKSLERPLGDKTRWWANGNIICNVVRALSRNGWCCDRSGIGL